MTKGEKFNLKISELGEFFFSIVDPYVVMDLKCNVIQMNTAAREFLELAPSEEPGNLSTFVHEDYRKYTEECYNTLVKEGSIRNYEAKIRTKKGTVKFVQINSSLVYDKKGRVVAAHGTIRDITEAVKNRETLAMQKTLTDMVFENFSMGVVLVYRDRIIKANKTIREFLGYSNSQITRMSFKDITFEDDISVSMAMMRKLFSGELNHFTVNKRYRKKDNSVFWAKTTVNGVRAEDGSLKYQVAIIEDLRTERKKTLITQMTDDITKSILGKIDISEIAQEMTSRITEYLGSDDCVIYIVDKKRRILEQVAAFGEKLDENNRIINKIELDFGTGIAGAVASSGKAEIVPDTSKDERYYVDNKRRFSEIAVPIISEGEVIGVIDSEHYQKNYYTVQHLEALQNVAGLAALQFKNAMSLKEREEAEEQLKISENSLSVVVKNIHAGVLLEDRNHRIATTNQMFCDIFNAGLRPKMIEERSFKSLIQEHKDLFTHPGEFLKKVDRIVEQEKIALAEEFELADGRILEQDYVPISNNGKVSGHLWTFSDVTEQRNYKRNLEAQKKRFQGIIANMNLGLMEVDNKDTIQTVNRSFCKMSGYSEEELLGKKAVTFLGKVDKEFALEKKNMRLKGISDSYEMQVKVKDGTLRYWSISGAPRYDEFGKIIGSIGIYMDITDKKDLELQKAELFKELKASNARLEEYAHIVSHDLKSPLRSISALTSWILEDYKDVMEDEGVFNLHMIQDKMDAMDNLISGILRYSSVGKSDGNEAVDVNQIIQRIREIIFIPDNVEIVITNPLPKVMADETKIYQLFQNLISNAVVNIESEKGIVAIDCVEKPIHWEFSVKDNGIGIPKEYHEKIFEIFQSVGGEAGHSSGIGLSIVKKIVDQYGGSIWLQSEVGEGTTFYFTLKK